MNKAEAIFILALVLTSFLGMAQVKGPELSGATNSWTASWIAPPNAPENEYGIYHFRKQMDLQSVPSSFIVHVSADNRYKLFVNGQLVSLGPARADVAHWNYETVDLAPYLEAGKNTLAAVVWNFGEHRAMPQHSWRTGFILQGKGPQERIADTNSSWKVIRNEAYAPIKTELYTYYVAGPGERIDYDRYVKDWKNANFNDRNWEEASVIAPAYNQEDTEGWQLTPSSLPPMELSPQRLAEVRKATGVEVPSDFLKKEVPLLIPANTRATLILDQGHLTTAFPVLTFSGGKGASVKISYAESLFEEMPGKDNPNALKGNRNEVEGKYFFGISDELLPDGGQQQIFSPLWWRAYRYIELEVDTKEEPLVIHDLYGLYTGYPFEKKSAFLAEDASDLNKILNIGWRTARLCAHETYMDTPYYEQLQYIGDARIQMLVTLYNTHDDRLVRNGIEQIQHSVSPEGITMSRYPSREPQYIPPFSLWWIGMLHDYWKYRGDAEFIRSALPVSRSVLNFFAEKQHPNGSLKPLPHWSFTDWTDNKHWTQWGSVAPSTEKGNSAPLDLQLLLGYQTAASLEEAVGEKQLASQYRARIDQLKKTAKDLYWDESKKLFSDTPEKKHYSQQTNTLAVLTGVVEGSEARKLMEKTLQDTSLVPASIYFKYYLHQAAAEAGLGDRYVDLLDVWREQISRGLTTWAEKGEPSRSDCHAWGSSPNIELYRIVLGIDSDAPGFEKVLIQPHLGSMKKAAGKIPHPKGEIAVNYKVNANGKLKAEVVLPEGVSGRLVWKGKEAALKGGKQLLEL